MNWFDIFIIIVTLYCIIKGYRSGFARQLTSLVGLIVGAIIAGKVSDLLLPYISQVIQAPESIVSSASYIIAFILILIVFYFIGTMLETIIKAVKLGFINKILGSFFCILKWYIAISIILNLVIKIDVDKKLINDRTSERSYTFRHIKDIAPIIVPYLKSKL